jgi:DNA-binding beta-propeller fold protein YncE
MCNIAIDHQTGYIYVCDSQNNRVQVFDESGTFIFKFGTKGESLGQFYLPGGLTINDNIIIVADTWNQRLQIFNKQGIFMSKFGSVGTGDCEFLWPRDVANIKSQQIVVCDRDNCMIRIFHLDKFKITHQIFKFGSKGSATGKFLYPEAVAVDDRNNNIIVADCFNNRIQVFDSHGSFLFKFVSLGSNDGQFKSPSEVSVTKQGLIVVSDNNHRIQVFSEYGEFIFKIKSRGRATGVCSNDNIIITYHENHRIEIWKPIY